MTSAAITTTTSDPARPIASRRHGTGFWIVAIAYLLTMAFSTVPTPLYGLYQLRDGFPTFLTTVIFAAYAVGVMASLYLAGHISDWVGRKRMIQVSILIELLAAAVFLIWPEVPGLIVARFVTGVGIGTLTATATAHLTELRAAGRPGNGPRTSAAVSTFANIGGLALGPLVAGVLAQFVIAPLAVPYWVFIVLLVASAVAVAFVPETIERSEVRHPYHPQRIALPKSARGRFFAAAVAAFAAFAVFGLFTSLAPSFIAGTLRETSHLVAGAITFAVFGAAAVAQVVFAGLALRRQLQLALVLMVAGLAFIAVGVLIVSLPVFVLAGIVAGAGVGVLFRASLSVAGSLAVPEARGEVLALLFLVAYAGLAIPVLLIGLALAFLPSSTVLVGFAVVVIALVSIFTARLIATTRAR